MSVALAMYSGAMLFDEAAVVDGGYGVVALETVAPCAVGVDARPYGLERECVANEGIGTADGRNRLGLTHAHVESEFHETIDFHVGVKTQVGALELVVRHHAVLLVVAGGGIYIYVLAAAAHTHRVVLHHGRTFLLWRRASWCRDR